MSSRLVLGTVQIGMPYGVNNSTGQPDLALAKAIVEEAFRQGITEFDTAQAYGQSETFLGLAFASLKITTQVRVITKLNPSINDSHLQEMVQSVVESCRRLSVKNLGVLMLHRQEQLSNWTPHLYPALSPLREQGLISRFGVSVYTPQAAKLALETNGIDCVQIPSNILDQRFEKAGIFKMAKDLGKDLYVRSVYLQGLLMMDLKQIPSHLQIAASYIAQVQELAKQYNVSRQSLCLGYALQKWPEVKVVVGAETLGQVTQNARIARESIPPALIENADTLFRNVDERIVNPVLWPKAQS